MPSSTLHQKCCFHHLPTRGRAGIRLGDAWYVSNVSIIFDCSMLYYLLFWTLLGFIIHCYIIFGTNLLTGGPAQNCCFLPVLGFRRKGISNGVQTEWNLRGRDFLNKQDPRDLYPTSRHKRGGHEVGERAYHPPRRALHPRGPPVAPLMYFFLLYIPTYPQRSDMEPKTKFHRCNFLYPRDPILGPVPELRWRGHWSRRASSSTPYPFRWSVSSLPQTYGSIVSS